MGKCLSFGFGFMIFLSILLTLVAILTPGWRSYKGQGAPDFGIATRYCGNGNRQVQAWDCSRWFGHKSLFEKTTLGLMIVALIAEVLAFGCFFTLFCSRVRLYNPTAAFTTIAFISTIAAVICYGVRFSYKTMYMSSQSYELLADVYLGYSYWIAVLSCFTLFIALGSAGGIVGDAHSSSIDRDAIERMGH